MWGDELTLRRTQTHYVIDTKTNAAHYISDLDKNCWVLSKSVRYVRRHTFAKYNYFLIFFPTSWRLLTSSHRPNPTSQTHPWLKGLETATLCAFWGLKCWAATFWGSQLTTLPSWEIPAKPIIVNNFSVTDLRYEISVNDLYYKSVLQSQELCIHFRSTTPRCGRKRSSGIVGSSKMRITQKCWLHHARVYPRSGFLSVVQLWSCDVPNQYGITELPTDKMLNLMNKHCQIYM